MFGLYRKIQNLRTGRVDTTAVAVAPPARTGRYSGATPGKLSVESWTVSTGGRNRWPITTKASEKAAGGLPPV
jgi:hypothetical protein